MKWTKRHPIALNLPHGVPSLIVYGRHVVLSMTGNVWFPSPTPTLALVTSDLDALEGAEAKARQRTMGAAAARDVVRKVVEDDLFGLMAHVRSIVAQNPGKELVIIESAGLSPKRYTPAQKLEIEALMGPTPGEVVVRAKARKRGAAYEWQWSSDGGESWVAMGTTTVANTTILGLAPGATYRFRFRVTIGKTTGGWSQSAGLFVR